MVTFVQTDASEHISPGRQNSMFFHLFIMNGLLFPLRMFSNDGVQPRLKMTDFPLPPCFPACLFLFLRFLYCLERSVLMLFL